MLWWYTSIFIQRSKITKLVMIWVLVKLFNLFSFLLVDDSNNKAQNYVATKSPEWLQEAALKLFSWHFCIFDEGYNHQTHHDTQQENNYLFTIFGTSNHLRWSLLNTLVLGFLNLENIPMKNLLNATLKVKPAQALLKARGHGYIFKLMHYC